MKNLFVSYEIAKLLKDKQFPNNTGSCLAAWENTENGQWLHFGSHPIGLLQAPLYQQVVDWFREKHKLILSAHPTTNGKYCSIIYRYPNNEIFQSIERFENYYDALNKTINVSINLI